jgi:hypothetical protein
MSWVINHSTAPKRHPPIQVNCPSKCSATRPANPLRTAQTPSPRRSLSLFLLLPAAAFPLHYALVTTALLGGGGGVGLALGTTGLDAVGYLADDLLEEVELLVGFDHGLDVLGRHALAAFGARYRRRFGN